MTMPSGSSPTPRLSLDVWAMIAAGVVFIVLVFAGVIPPAWQ